MDDDHLGGVVGGRQRQVGPVADGDRPSGRGCRPGHCDVAAEADENAAVGDLRRGVGRKVGGKSFRGRSEVDQDARWQPHPVTIVVQLHLTPARDGPDVHRHGRAVGRHQREGAVVTQVDQRGTDGRIDETVGPLRCIERDS